MMDALALGAEQLDELAAAVLVRGAEDLRQIGAEACLGHGCSSGSGARGVSAWPAARNGVRRGDGAAYAKGVTGATFVFTNLPGVVGRSPIIRDFHGPRARPVGTASGCRDEAAQELDQPTRLGRLERSESLGHGLVGDRRHLAQDAGTRRKHLDQV